MLKVVTPWRGFKLQLTQSHVAPCFCSEEILVLAGTGLIEQDLDFRLRLLFVSKIEKVLSSMGDCRVPRQLLICTETFKVVTEEMKLSEGSLSGKQELCLLVVQSCPQAAGTSLYLPCWVRWLFPGNKCKP